MRKFPLLVTVVSGFGLTTCQQSSPPTGDGQANRGGASGSGGARFDTDADAGTHPEAGPPSDGRSGGTTAATGGATAGSGGAGGPSSAATGGVGGSGSGGGAATATGGGGQTGRGGSVAAAGHGGGSSGGAGGRAVPVAICPFTSAEELIWPGAAPGGAGVTVVESTVDLSTNSQVRERQITGVTRPSIFPFLASKPNGAAAIILPGGGYRYVSYDREGTDIASWLNSIGVSAFVVKYRLPLDFPASTWVALADAQRALRLVRKSAATCKIDPARIGVIGFSAGGHLASQLETRFTARLTSAVDDVDDVDARPAFSVLMYPVISMDAAIAHAGSRTLLLGTNPTPAEVTLTSSELQVTSTTPATFIGTSLRDATVKPENSIRFDSALAVAGVPHELHLYQDGGHGTGIRAATGDMASWPAQCASWLTGANFLSGPVP